MNLNFRVHIFIKRKTDESLEGTFQHVVGDISVPLCDREEETFVTSNM